MKIPDSRLGRSEREALAYHIRARYNMSARSKEQELEGGMLNSRDLRITTICENTAGRGGVLAEW